MRTERIPDLALGVDQASVSGYGVMWIGGDYVEHGLARTNVDRTRLLERVAKLVGGDMTRVLVMLEDHTKMPLSRLGRFDRKTRRTTSQRAGGVERGTPQIIGMGDARGRWREKLEDFGHPKLLRDAVPPFAWRARMGIRGNSPDALKKAACEWATLRLGMPIKNHNHAEGVCLTEFCSRDGVARLHQRRAAARQKRIDEKRRKGQLILPTDLGFDVDNDVLEDGEEVA